MKKVLLAAAASVAFGLTSAPQAQAHNYLNIKTAPAGFMETLRMRVPHGCKGSPINQVRIRIPEGMYRVTADHMPGWDIELKMRSVEPPVVGDGGRPITETVDEIQWTAKGAPLPSDRTGEFVFRGKLPEEVGRVVFFRTINNCLEGDEPYVDLPEKELDIASPDFHKDFWAFMSASAFPSPYVVLSKPERPQNPWEWDRPEHKADFIVPEQEASAE